MKQYRLADASIAGTTHRRMRYNNQDASTYVIRDNIIVGVVCDGCGSSAHSEVGAQLGARYIVAKTAELFWEQPFSVESLSRQIEIFLRDLVATNSPDDSDDFVLDYLLFTFVGFVVKPELTHLFWAGDGVVSVNDKVTIIDQQNRPKYYAYNLLGENSEIEHQVVDTVSVSHLLIGTDGVESIISNQGASIGSSISILPIRDFFKNERFFSNPVALSKYLSEIEATESYLLDDTSMVLLKSR